MPGDRSARLNAVGQLRLVIRVLILESGELRPLGVGGKGDRSDTGHGERFLGRSAQFADLRNGGIEVVDGDVRDPARWSIDRRAKATEQSLAHAEHRVGAGAHVLGVESPAEQGLVKLGRLGRIGGKEIVPDEVTLAHMISFRSTSRGRNGTSQ